MSGEEFSEMKGNTNTKKIFVGDYNSLMIKAAFILPIFGGGA